MIGTYILSNFLYVLRNQKCDLYQNIDSIVDYSLAQRPCPVRPFGLLFVGHFFEFGLVAVSLVIGLIRLPIEGNFVVVYAKYLVSLAFCLELSSILILYLACYIYLIPNLNSSLLSLCFNNYLGKFLISIILTLLDCFVGCSLLAHLCFKYYLF